MDAPAARRLQGADLGGEVLPLGPGHPGVADQYRSRCVIRLLFRFVWQLVFARCNPLFRLRLRRRRTNDRLRTPRHAATRCSKSIRRLRSAVSRP
jgi:hypothetical protein